MTEVQNRRVANYYASLHSFYDTIFEYSGYYNLGWLPEGSKGDFTDGQKNLVSLVTQPLRRFSGGRILETGCGQGSPAEQTSKELGVKMIGLELLPSQLKVGRGRANSSLKFVQGDACVLPFADCSFDGIVSLESAFHYSDKRAFIAECSRVLKPGGMLSLADIMTTTSAGGRVGLRSIAKAAGAESFYSEQQYLDLASDARLRIISSEDITCGVARSFRNTAFRVAKHWKKLRRGFSAWVLGGVIVISFAHPLVYRWLPVRYRWMVFEKGK